MLLVDLASPSIVRGLTDEMAGEGLEPGPCRVRCSVAHILIYRLALHKI